METADRSEQGTKNRTTVERRSDRELIVTRTFNAPARIVFDAWTNPDLLQRWWAPRSLGVTLFSCDSDVRVGGRYRFEFGRDPKKPMVFSGKYTEVSPCSRLVCTQLFEQMPAAGEAIVTATFTERAGKTELVLSQLFPSKEALDGAVASGMEKGMRDTYEQLEQLVASLAPAPTKNRTTVEHKSERELVIRRTFDGPARLVFEAWTKPELLERWWVPKSTGMVLVSCEADVRVGGSYRFVLSHPASKEPMTFFGKYLEVTPNARLVWTNEESGHGGSVTTVTFEEKGGKTLVVMSDLYPSKEALDAATAGMEGGMQETFAQLDELLVTLGSSVRPS